MIKPVFSDVRRDLIVPGNSSETIDYCVGHFLQLANRAISKRGRFAVALSGGKTPQALFRSLAQSNEAKKIDWSKVFLFWSDERAVPPNDPESNYGMAMSSGFEKLAVPEGQIFRMVAEKEIDAHAIAYEKLIQKNLPDCRFDLVMLGIGDDGHTASLFPHTPALDIIEKLVIAYYVPQKDAWRMTLTFSAINNARNICIYVLGNKKAHILSQVLKGAHHPHHYPAQNVGTPTNRALWIADKEAAAHWPC